MHLEFKNLAQGLFVLLFACLALNSKALASDRKASLALGHYIMGVMYDDLGDIDKAIHEYKESIGIDNEVLVVHLNLASSYIKNKEIPKAIEELNLSIRLDPEAVEPHAILALIYATENKPDLAAGEYEVALKNASKVQPKNIEIYKNLGAIYLDQKKFKDAESVYQMMIKLSPDDAQGHFYLGCVYNELKQNDLAEKELKKALELKPDFDAALNSLGYIYVEENGNLAQAEVMIKKALEIAPDNGAYVDSLGWLYFKKGDFALAIKELERAKSLMDDPVIYDHLGEAYLKANDIASAILNWKKSLELDPKQDSVKEKLDKITK